MFRKTINAWTTIHSKERNGIPKSTVWNIHDTILWNNHETESTIGTISMIWDHNIEESNEFWVGVGVILDHLKYMHIPLCEQSILEIVWKRWFWSWNFNVDFTKLACRWPVSNETNYQRIPGLLILLNIDEWGSLNFAGHSHT